MEAATASAQARTSHWSGAVEVISLSEELTQETAVILQARNIASNPVRAAKRRLGLLAAKDENLPLRERARLEKRLPLRAQVIKLAKARLPILSWFPQLTLRKVYADVVAGVTVGVIVVPQGMSYAAVAGLPYVYGLYSACIPPLVYGIFGLSRQLAVGPVAVVSLLVQSGLMEVMTEDECPAWFASGRAQHKLQSKVCPDEYVKLATLTAFCAGMLLLMAYILRLGFLVSFMGHPVTNGYTSGAAIIIMMSQLKGVFGFSIPQSQVLQDTVAAIVQNIRRTNGTTLGLSIAWLVLLVGCRRIGKRWTRFSLVGAFGPLCSCILGILLLRTWPDLALSRDVAYVGVLPQGFMPFMAKQWDFSALRRVLPTAITVCYVGYIEAIAIGKAMAAKHNYYVEPGQELLTLGLCNAIGSLFGAYPVTGSFSRSAVKLDLNAQTQLSSVVTSGVVCCAILFLTSTFYWLPKFVLSAVVISSVLPLCDFEEAYKIYKISQLDGFLWVLAFLGVLFLGVEIGIGLAVAASLVIVVYESVRPQLTVLWRIPGTSIYRNIKQESQGSFVESVFIVRLGASLFFANVQYVKDMLVTYIDDLEEVNKTRYLVLEMTAVISVDATAARVIRDIVHEFRHRGVELAFAMVGNRVASTLERAGLKAEVGEEWFFHSVHEAVLHCMQHLHAGPGQEQHAIEEQHALEEGSRGPGASTAGPGEPQVGGPGHEVGFSNSFHATCTAMFLALAPAERPMIMIEIAAVFNRSAVNVLRAQVEAMNDAVGAKHLYLLQKFAGSKLSEGEIEALRLEVEGLLHGTMPAQGTRPTR